MKNIFIVIFLVFTSFSIHAQKYDYQWPMGYSTDAPPFEFWGISILDFSGPEIDMYVFNQAYHPIQLPNSSSFICDENGELLLMTNNCKVFNKDFQIVPGTDTLTPGTTFNFNCEQYGEYPTSQTSLIIPEINNDSTVYVIHKDSEISDVLQAKISKNLYLSILTKKGDGSFYLKETKSLINQEMIPGKLTACINEEGNQWWVWTADYHTNTFYKFLIGGQDTVQGPFVQQIGGVLKDQNIGINQTAFSPNAKMLGISTDNQNVLLYDFDNGSGELSNYRALTYTDDEDENGSGLAFSFDSRFVYLTTVENVYQLDLQDSTVEHIAHHFSYDEHNWPVTIGKMHLGPDCRIYIDPGSTTFYIHVIHQPNKKGGACQFEARALRSPTKINFNFPNLPMYRFDGACDSTIQFPVVNSVETNPEGEEEIKVFPNPFLNELTVSFDRQNSGNIQFKIYDAIGRKHLESMLPAFHNTLAMGSMPTGLYFYEIWEKDVLLKSGKLVKVE